MNFKVLTIFPEMFSALDCSILGRAMKNEKFSLDVVNIRDYSTDKHSKTDDAPFGGGAGMVMTCQPIVDAIRAVDPDRKLCRISIGDYVLTGGELPAMVLINCVSRYIDGVLGSRESVLEESFSENLLEYPQYTRPAVFEGLAIPEVLLSGNHAEVAKWRREQAIELTKKLRPDLLGE